MAPVFRLRTGRKRKSLATPTPWEDRVEDEEDARIKETWAFEYLESFQNEFFPDGFPPGLDLNRVFGELDRSLFGDPDAHTITQQWRDNTQAILAFGRAMSRRQSWREVVGGSTPHKIPAIGGKEELTALAVLHHRQNMDRWLSDLLSLLQLDWAIDPTRHKPEFWDGVKLSRGSEFQEAWCQGRPRELHCDIRELLSSSLASNAIEEAPRASKQRKLNRSSRNGDSEIAKSNSIDPSNVVDSDDEPLLRRRSRSEGDAALHLRPHQALNENEDSRQKGQSQSLEHENKMLRRENKALKEAAERAERRRLEQENEMLKMQKSALEERIERLEELGRNELDKVMARLEAIEDRVEEVEEGEEGVTQDLHYLKTDAHRNIGRWQTIDAKSAELERRMERVERRVPSYPQ